MPPSKWIRVRPLEVSDFSFVRRLASKQPHFTNPPRYVLWLLKQAHPRSCMVAEHVKFGPVAYLLSLLVSTSRGNVLYVWQLAASASGRRTGAIDVLLLALRNLVRRARVKTLFFTADPESSQFRAIRRYAYTLSRDVPHSHQKLPSTVSRNEREFTLKVHQSSE
jgi:hypothetical protein